MENWKFGQIYKSTGVVVIPYAPDGQEEPEVEMSFNQIVPKEEIKPALEKQGYEIVEDEE